MKKAYKIYCTLMWEGGQSSYTIAMVTPDFKEIKHAEKYLSELKAPKPETELGEFKQFFFIAKTYIK